MSETSIHLEPRVSRLEGELAQLVTTVGDLTHSMETWQRDISGKIDRISDRSRPDFGLMAQWSGIILLIIGMIAAPIGYYFNTNMTQLDNKLQKEYQLVTETQKERQNTAFAAIAELDARLQRETILQTETLREQVNTLNKSVEQLDVRLQREFNLSSGNMQLVAEKSDSQIQKIQDWINDGIKADLEELRLRRMNK